MTQSSADIVIVGAGPVGLMCAYLSQLCGMNAIILDKSEHPLKVGRADALNARTLQLLELAGLFDELYPLGKPCHTSSVWANGKFVSRESRWWDELEGCAHKHFLMLGQSHVEKALDQKLSALGTPVRRQCPVTDIHITNNTCITTLETGETITSNYVIGADGSRSLVRSRFQIPFEIIRPEIVWAVIDGEIETDFPKVPEIIVFQADTSDVAWIPREGKIDRFYVRMDRKDFSLEDCLKKINRAMAPHTLRFRDISWFSQFSVKESVAERFSVQNRIFLAGDACHIHSVNGGQGLNTGLADAFNLIWKLRMATQEKAPDAILNSYESERKPVARSVIETSGELVRSTKFSATGTHAQDYVKIVEKRAGNITGMGIRYSGEGLVGQRLFDFPTDKRSRIYSHLSYDKHSLLVFGDFQPVRQLPNWVQMIKISEPTRYYANQALLVRPDSYIAAAWDLSSTTETEILDELKRQSPCLS